MRLSATAALPSPPRETGIIMTGPSVPAIAAGAKTQTRRIVKDAPDDVYEVVPSLLIHRGDLWDFRRRDEHGLPHNPVEIRCPYGAPRRRRVGAEPVGLGADLSEDHMTRTRLPHLTCCDQGADFVFLRLDAEALYYTDHENRDAYLAIARETPPKWVVLARNITRQLDAYVTVAACPFCATPVAAVRLRTQPPRRICVVIDGGYYCDTCARRLIACRCAPPEQLWEAVP